MKLLKIRLTGVSASFRNPLSMSYQSTLPFPSRPTIFGILGAVSGMEYFTAQDKFSCCSFGVRTCGIAGKSNDLWAIRKLKSGSKGLTALKDVVVREMLFSPEFIIYVRADEGILRELQESFRRPAFPLCFGRNDDIVTEVSCDLVSAEEQSDVMINSIVVRGRLNPEEIKVSGLDDAVEDTSAFPVFRLPDRFDRHKRNPQIRVPTDYHDYTLVNRPVITRRPAVCIGDESFIFWS
jgi:CRISPR-associated protein Cas5t